MDIGEERRGREIWIGCKIWRRRPRAPAAVLGSAGADRTWLSHTHTHACSLSSAGTSPLATTHQESRTISEFFFYAVTYHGPSQLDRLNAGLS